MIEVHVRTALFDYQFIFLIQMFSTDAGSNGLPGGHSKWVPPESISNSVVKTFRADDSAEEFRVKVGTAGHCFVPTRHSHHVDDVPF